MPLYLSCALAFAASSLIILFLTFLIVPKHLARSFFEAAGAVGCIGALWAVLGTLVQYA
jgi:hypothetical protein